MDKYAILLLTEPGNHEALARAYHALLYANDLHENGFDAEVILDGAGTAWLKEFANPNHPLRKMFDTANEEGLIGGYCPYCADSFKVEKQIPADLHVKGLTEYGDHPSIAKLAREGFKIITI